MLPQTEAIIYLADQRGCSLKEWHRSYHTFNFGAYFSESRKSFANLQVVNDDTLKAGRTLTQEVKENAWILLLPLVGTLDVQHQFKTRSVEVGQCCQFFAPKDSTFEITNAYESELINFLQIWQTTESIDESIDFVTTEFDLDLQKNKLISLSINRESIRENTLALVGKFNGRNEAVIHLKNPQKGAFAFVIEGAFEVQNRLLRSRDGLALWNLSEIEFEALSNDAIILIIEN